MSIPPEHLVMAAIQLAELVATECHVEFKQALTAMLGQSDAAPDSRAKVQFKFALDQEAGRFKITSWGRSLVSVDLRALSEGGRVR